MECPVCGRGKLIRELKPHTYEYRKQKLEIEYEVETCDVCKESFVVHGEIKTLESVLRKFKKDVDKMIGESNKIEPLEIPESKI